MTNKIKAFAMTPLMQSVLDVAIKAGVAMAILLLNALMSALSGGAITIPANFGGAITLSILTLLVSQFDSKFVAWSATLPAGQTTP